MKVNSYYNTKGWSNHNAVKTERARLKLCRDTVGNYITTHNDNKNKFKRDPGACIEKED